MVLFSTRLSYHNKQSPRFAPWRRQHRGSGGRRRVPTGIRRRSEPRGKKSGAAASGGARDDKTSETSTVQSISLSTSAPARTRNPISKQLHRKKGGSELRMQYYNVPECSYTTVKYCTSQFTTFLCARSNTVQSIQNITIIGQSRGSGREQVKVRGEQTSGFLIPTMSVCTCTCIAVALCSTTTKKKHKPKKRLPVTTTPTTSTRSSNANIPKYHSKRPYPRIPSRHHPAPHTPHTTPKSHPTWLTNTHQPRTTKFSKTYTEITGSRP